MKKNFYNVHEINKMINYRNELKEGLKDPNKFNGCRTSVEAMVEEMDRRIKFIYDNSNTDTIDKVTAYRMGNGDGEEKIYVKKQYKIKYETK